MNFDKLMEFIEGDEEMGDMTFDGCLCLICINANEGEKILDVYFYGRYEDDYEINKDMLDDNFVKYHLSYDEELSCEKITVDICTTCIFGSCDRNDKGSSSISVFMAGCVELPNSVAHFELIRQRGKKKFEITLLIDSEQEAILDSFCNWHKVHCPKLYKGVWIDPDDPPIKVRCNFLPTRADRN